MSNRKCEISGLLLSKREALEDEGAYCATSRIRDSHAATSIVLKTLLVQRKSLSPVRFPFLLFTYRRRAPGEKELWELWVIFILLKGRKKMNWVRECAQSRGLTELLS